MDKKIKLSLIDENGVELDCITRSIPLYMKYNFSKGVLVDLLMLLERNKVYIEIVENVKENILSNI